MRTTISLEDRLAVEVKRQAAEAGLSVSAYIARVLDDSIKRQAPAPVEPFRLITAGGKGVNPGFDIDHPRAIEVAEDEDLWAKVP